MWWWCQGDPTIQWGEAQKKDMKAALFKALGAAKMTRSKSNFKGVNPLPAPPKDTYTAYLDYNLAQVFTKTIASQQF